jgi:hypothetical protein
MQHGVAGDAETGATLYMGRDSSITIEENGARLSAQPIPDVGAAGSDH